MTVFWRHCLPPAIDRSVSSSLGDARDALLNAVVDGLGVYRNTVSTLQQHGLIAPDNLRLFPLYILALLKQVLMLHGPFRYMSAHNKPQCIYF
jgi:hypothetical protein